jgi:hypothetical protein
MRRENVQIRKKLKDDYNRALKKKKSINSAPAA